MLKAPYFPIIYVRGYAGTQGGIEDTSATPHMGFNLGSTKYRQTYTGEVEPYVFESPLIRLMKDHGYHDAYHDGQIKPKGPVDPKSIWIYRYYDYASKSFGDGKDKEIEFYAEKLQEFILHVREAVGMKNDNRFKTYLVAHSMGGLVCRCYLQNKNIPDLEGNGSGDWTKKGVDKLFTYATPHGGIEFRKGLGWVDGLRDFLDVGNSANFGPKRMREFLDLDEETELNSLNGQFPAERVFCLIGTDARDYIAVNKAVGPKSDGLVQIENAYTWGSPRAYVHRSHSGHYGIVNSENGYRNLERFLFGDMRVSVRLDDIEVSLPEKNDKLTAVYNIENIVGIRGLPIPLNQRTVADHSATFRTQDWLTSKPTFLFTAFLAKKLRTGNNRSLSFSVTFKIIPTYYKEISFWPDKNYEGQAVFDDRLIIDVFIQADGSYKARYGWGSQSLKATKALPFTEEGDKFTAKIPFKRTKPVKISGNISFKASPWN